MTENEEIDQFLDWVEHYLDPRYGNNKLSWKVARRGRERGVWDFERAEIGSGDNQSSVIKLYISRSTKK